MCDGIVVPTIAKWLSVENNVYGEPNYHSLELSKLKSVEILKSTYPYLYTKQPRAKFLLDAAKIKNTNTLYTTQEKRNWENCYTSLKNLNKRVNLV